MRDALQDSQLIMLLLACLLWRLCGCTLGGPMWSQAVDPVRDGASRPLFHRLPMFLHAPRPLVARELLRPLPRRGGPEPGLTALLLPVARPQLGGPRPGSRAVQVWCGTDTIAVRVDRLQLRAWTTPSLFRLGTCGASRVSPRFLYFHCGLTECGGQPQVVGGQLVYTCSLLYTPPPQGPIIRVPPLHLPIHCHYNRFHYAYKVGFRPQVQHTTFLKSISSKLAFSLTVCNAQWEPLPPGHLFFLGEQVHFVAQTGALLAGERLYLDSCYATSSKDPTSMPRVDIITNYGCMADSQREGSSSQFLSRGANVLRFSVDVFLFRAASQVQYLHCSVSVGLTPSHIAKSCNYNKAAGRWEELEASPSVCACCDAVCADKQHFIKNTVSSPAWLVEPKYEEKPRTRTISFQAEEGKEWVDQKDKGEEGMEVHLKVQTAPQDTKFGHEKKNEEIFAKAEEWRLAASKEEGSEAEVVEKVDSQLKEVTTDGIIMSDERRLHDAAQAEEEVPGSKTHSVTGLPGDNTMTNVSGESSSATTMTKRNSTLGIECNTSNHGSPEDVSTAPITTLCSDSDMHPSAVNSLIQHDGGSNIAGHGTMNTTVNTAFFIHDQVKVTSGTSALTSVRYSDDRKSLPGSRMETLAEVHSVTSDLESDTLEFPDVRQSGKSRMELDKKGTVLWLEQIKCVNKSADIMSEKIPGQSGDSVSSKGSERNHLRHFRGLESDQSTHPDRFRNVPCADGILGATDSESGIEESEALCLSQFTGSVKTKKEEFSGTVARPLCAGSVSVSTTQTLDESPSHSAMVTLRGPENSPVTDGSWVDAVPGLRRLGFVVEQPTEVEREQRQSVMGDSV